MKFQIKKKRLKIRMSICRRSAQWGLHTKQWHLINCERQPLEVVTKVAVAALEGRRKQIYTPQKVRI